jgi:uncharacterized protein (TIGR03437 family)
MRATLLLVGTALAVMGQNYSFVRVVGWTTPRPDGRGLFNLNVLTRPAMEGTRIVFTTVQQDASLWSYDVADGAFVKLADTSTPAPGGTGNFTDFATLDSKPLLSGGTAVFLAYDARTRPNQGLYSVPASGGPVTRIANYNSRSPGGVAFGDLDASFRQPFGGFAVHEGTAVFTVTLVDGNPGIYTANLDGSALTRIADRDLRLPAPVGIFDVNLWQNPWIWRGGLVFYGQTLMDPSTGYNGIYSAPATGGRPELVFSSRTPLPEHSNVHTRVRIPTLQMESDLIAFVADDPAQGGERRFRGLYTMPRAGGPLRRIADINSQLPGMRTPLTATSFASYSLNGGSILFRAVGGPQEGFSGGEQALMLWRNGQITRVIGTGDTLDGRIVRQVYDLSPQAMSGERLTFLVDFSGSTQLAVYAAAPVSATRVTGLQNSASYTSNVVAPGGVVTVYGAEMGPADVVSFQFDSANRIPATLAGSRILFNGVPAPVLYVSATQASAIAPFSLDGSTSAEVVVQSPRGGSAPFRVPVVAADPGLFSANRTGTGAGAILNEDGSFNSAERPALPGSVVVLFGAGFGQTNPGSVEGQITPSVNPPRLRSPVTVTIGGTNAQVLYQGPAPGAIAGLYQFNVLIPPEAPAGELPVRITIGTAATQSNLTVAVQAP